MSRAKPTDEGAEGRRLVAAAYAGSWRPSKESREKARNRAEGWLICAFAEDEAEEIDKSIRRAVVAAIVKRWPELELDRMYTAKVVRDICRGTCAVSDGWRVRLEALGGAS
jgi:hypothetical protein